MIADVYPASLSGPIHFGPVPRDAELACEEVFGPVLSALILEGEADALALANGTEYGLIAGVWTNDNACALRGGYRSGRSM